MEPGGIHGNVSTPLPPYTQEQHGPSDSGADAPSTVTIVVGVLVPLILIGVGAFIVYVWYRRKYPVRMVPGRDFAKFSNPAYSKRLSTFTLVREDGDKEWDNLSNPNSILEAVKEDEIDGIDNAAFENETEKDLPDSFVTVEIEDVASDTVKAKVEEKEVIQKISRERPKTKKAVLVKSQDIDEFDNGFELVSESDLGQRTDSDISSGNDSTETHTVSVSFAETFDNRHGSTSSHPAETKPSDVQEAESNDYTVDSSKDDAQSSDIKTTVKTSTENKTEKPKMDDNFESFVDVFNNDLSDEKDTDTSQPVPADGSTEMADDEDIPTTDIMHGKADLSFNEIENSFVKVEELGASQSLEKLDFHEKEQTEYRDKDTQLSPISMNSQSASVESVDRTSLEPFPSNSLTKQPLSLSSDRIVLDSVPQTPTVIVPDSIIFESETRPQIHLDAQEVQPLRGRRAFTLNDLSMDKKMSVSANSDQALVEARSTSSPEIRFENKGEDVNCKILSRTNHLSSTPESMKSTDINNKSTPLSNTLSDNLLLDSTLIKNEVRTAENKSEHVLNTVEETNDSVTKSGQSETSEKQDLPDNTKDVDNMFTSIASDVSENFETSDDEREIASAECKPIYDGHETKLTESIRRENQFQEIIESERTNTKADVEESFDNNPKAVEMDYSPSNHSAAIDNVEEFGLIGPTVTSPDANRLLQSDSSIDDKFSNSSDNNLVLLGQSQLSMEENLFTFNNKDADLNKQTTTSPTTTDDFAISILHTSTPTASGVEDFTTISSEITETTSKKKLTVGGFDFNKSDDDSDSSSSSSSSSPSSSSLSSESPKEFNRKSFSAKEDSSSDISEVELTVSFERGFTHSDVDTSFKSDSFVTLDEKPGMSKSADSTTLSWEYLIAENNQGGSDSHESEVTDPSLIHGIREHESSAFGNEKDSSTLEITAPNDSVDSSDLSWDIIGGNDDNSEC